MKKQLLFILGTLLLLASCDSKKEVTFTYSPTAPCAGATIKFSNSTQEGEDWLWNFGDGTTSTSKSPSKIYKKPGTYTVVLKVDDKRSRTCTQTITVYDSIPGISASDTTIYYYRKLTLTAESYNPYSYNRTYSWELGDGVKLLDGELDESSIDVCFTKLGGVRVVCRMTQGSQDMTLDSTFQVRDTIARALVLARGNQIQHQRIYEYGFEEAIAYPASSNILSAPSTLIAADDRLYIFNDDQAQSGTIGVYDIAAKTSEVVVKNGAAGNGMGYQHGCLADGMLYWTSADQLYRISATARNAQYTTVSFSCWLTSAAGIGYCLPAGLTSAGLLSYNGVLLYAYSSGLHRFTPAELGNTPVEGSILTDYAITALALDPTSQKLYFCTADGLYVANINGEYPVSLSAEADGKALCVALEDNLLFFTTAQGVMAMPLVHSQNNQHQLTATQVNGFTDVSALTVDRVQR